MGRKPLDHVTDAGTEKRPEEYARIERETADPVTDPKVKALAKAAHADEEKAAPTRVKKFLKIDRQKPEE